MEPMFLFGGRYNETVMEMKFVWQKLSVGFCEKMQPMGKKSGVSKISNVRRV